jgi:hypothetical protein
MKRYAVVESEFLRNRTFRWYVRDNSTGKPAVTEQIKGVEVPKMFRSAQVATWIANKLEREHAESLAK